MTQGRSGGQAVSALAQPCPGAPTSHPGILSSPCTCSVSSAVTHSADVPGSCGINLVRNYRRRSSSPFPVLCCCRAGLPDIRSQSPPQPSSTLTGRAACHPHAHSTSPRPAPPWSLVGARQGAPGPSAIHSPKSHQHVLALLQEGTNLSGSPPRLDPRAPQQGDGQAGARLGWPRAVKSIAALPRREAGLGKGFCCRREGISCAVPRGRGGSETPLFKGRR